MLYKYCQCIKTHTLKRTALSKAVAERRRGLLRCVRADQSVQTGLFLKDLKKTVS